MIKKLTLKEKKRYIDMIDSFSKRDYLKSKIKASWFITDELVDNDYDYYQYTIYFDDYKDELSPMGYLDTCNATSKGELREQAIDYQRWASEQSLSMFELGCFSDYFERLGKRYGLLKEFRENGII